MSVAGNWIPTGNDQPRLTQELRDSIRQLLQGYKRLEALAAVMTQMNAGGTNYTTIETYFSVQAGSGQAVNDIVGSAVTDLQGSAMQQLFQRLL